MSDKKIPRMSEFSDIRGEIFVAAADKLLKIPYLPVTRLIRSDPSCLESFGKYRVTVSSPLLIFCLVSLHFGRGFHTFKTFCHVFDQKFLSIFFRLDVLRL